LRTAEAYPVETGFFQKRGVMGRFCTAVTW